MCFSLSSLATLDSIFLLPIDQQGRWIRQHFTFTFGNQYIGVFKEDSQFVTAVAMGEVPTDPDLSTVVILPQSIPSHPTPSSIKIIGNKDVHAVSTQLPNAIDYYFI